MMFEDSFRECPAYDEKLVQARVASQASLSHSSQDFELKNGAE